MKHVIRPAARADILSQYIYYAVDQDAQKAADRFLKSVQNAVDALCLHPEMGAPKAFENPALANLRFWHVKGFPETRIYYLISGKALHVVRVLHSKRDIDPLMEEPST